MKRIILFTLALQATLCAMAVPALRIRFQATQKDGSTVAVTLHGDENLHYYLTDDAQPVLQAEDGSFYHATTDVLGLMRPSSVLAHDADSRGDIENQFLSLRGDGQELIGTAMRKTRAATSDIRRARPSQPIAGERKGLVILVEYADVKFARDNVQAYYDRLLNGEGAPENDVHASVNRYFLDQSNGLFNLTFDVVGPVTMSNNRSYYGANDIYGNDQRAEYMVEEACRMVNPDVDFSTYDWDQDGTVEQVFVVYAGHGEAGGGGKDCVWPHAYYVRNLNLDGVKVSQYACSCELYGDKGTIPDGIGTFCHEFSHCLGLADLYKTKGGSVYGFSVWSLMDWGCYCGKNMRGETPVNYTSFERYFCGWDTPVTLVSPCRVEDMASLSEGGQSYIIYNDACKSEAYMLENRQLIGWDKHIYGHGLLILHVDYDESVWESNTVNNNVNHQRCTIFLADNNEDFSVPSIQGDVYPGTSGNTSLTDTSVPAARLLNAGPDGRYFMGKPIEDITESENGLISFTFCGGTNAIHEVKADGRSDGQWYDLNGTPVDKPARGVYVRNGKKILVK